MNTLSWVVVCGLVLFLQTPVALAAQDVGQGRLFLGSTSTEPQELKAELAAQNLKDMKAITQFGVEITFPTFKYLQLGLRYSRHLLSQDELVTDYNTDYKAEIVQDSMFGIARVPFFKTDLVILDVFVGAGASNTTFTEKVVGQEGELVKKYSPIVAAGASAAIGYKKFYLFAEGGVESNKVTDFTRSGNLSNTMNTIDLSGPYFMIGVLFDGIPIYKK